MNPRMRRDITGHPAFVGTPHAGVLIDGDLTPGEAPWCLTPAGESGRCYLKCVRHGDGCRPSYCDASILKNDFLVEGPQCLV